MRLKTSTIEVIYLESKREIPVSDVFLIAHF